LSGSYGAFGTLALCYSDAGLGGRAILQYYNTPDWVEDTQGQISPGQAKYISMSNATLIGFADATANDSLMVRTGSGTSWTTLPFPQVPIVSCSVGYYGTGKAFAAYITSDTDGRNLRLDYMP
jgi:hypothetical protein